MELKWNFLNSNKKQDVFFTFFISLRIKNAVFNVFWFRIKNVKNVFCNYALLTYSNYDLISLSFQHLQFTILMTSRVSQTNYCPRLVIPHNIQDRKEILDS